MPLNLHEFQETIIKESRVALRTHNSILIQLATGGGKTVIAAFIIQAALRAGIPVKFICHRSELLLQTCKTMDKLELSYGIIAANVKPDYTELFQICSIDTLKNRLDHVDKTGLTIWDESHHLGAKGWSRVKETLSSSKHIGLSATPERLDGIGLIEHFSYMVKGPQMRWLIDNHFLSDFIYYAPTQPDISHVHLLGGELRTDELEEVMDTPSITGDIIYHWKKRALGKRTLFFGVSRKHSIHMAEQFRAAGVMAIHIDGTTSESMRRSASLGLASGDIQIVCNVDLCGEGYDLSALARQNCPIEALIIGRHTMSKPKHLQMCGRPLRYKPEPAVILDHVGNYMRHGFPDDDHDWTLEGKKRTRKSMAEQAIMTRQCPKCQGTHRAAMICPYCGHEYEIQSRSIEEKEGELEEIDRDKAREALKQKNKKDMGNARTLEQLIEVGRKKGYGGGSEAGLIRWANYRLAGRRTAAQKYRRGW